MSMRKLAALLLASALAMSACGSDSAGDDAAEETTESTEETTESTESSDDGADAGDDDGDMEEMTEDEGLARAQEAVAQFQTPDQPIGVTIPLSGTPEPKTIAWLECELESCPYITTGMQDAVDALGWELVVISSESANPAPYMQQAIDQGVDFIASSGLAPALYEEQAAAAAEAGIAILSVYDTTAPDPANSNIYTQFGDASFVEKTGPVMANWAVADSEGTANILIVSIPDFPVLVAETDAFKAELEANCSGCEYTELNITIPQLVGGEVPSAVASQLQANGDIDYAFFSFGSLPFGVTEALSSAGLLDQVTVYGQDFSGFGLQEIVDGTMASWAANPKGYAGWLMVDAAARISLGMDLEEERSAAALPTFIVEDAATAQAILDDTAGDWYPQGTAEAFKALWGVD